MLRGISQFSLLARFYRIFAKHRARAHRSREVSKDCTRSGPAIFATFAIFERDQRVIARTPSRQFHFPNGAKAFSGRDRVDPAPGASDLFLRKAGGVAGFEDSVCA